MRRDYFRPSKNTGVVVTERERRRTIILRRPERARKEGSTGPNRLGDTRCTVYRRRIKYNGFRFRADMVRIRQSRPPSDVSRKAKVLSAFEAGPRRLPGRTPPPHPRVLEPLSYMWGFKTTTFRKRFVPGYASGTTWGRERSGVEEGLTECF